MTGYGMNGQLEVSNLPLNGFKMLGYKYMSLTETHNKYNYNPYVVINDGEGNQIDRFAYRGYAPSTWKPFTRYDLSRITTEGYMTWHQSDGGNFLGGEWWNLLFEKT